MCCVPSLFATLWTVACQASQSLRLSQQEYWSVQLKKEYWSGLPFPTPGDLPHPGIKPKSPVAPALAGSFFTTEASWGDTTMFIFHEVENFQPTCGFGYLPVGSRGHMFSS